MRLMTEIDVMIDGVVGNFNYIADRYPNDKVLLEKLQYLSSYCLQLGNLIGSDKGAGQKLNERLRKDRYRNGKY